MLFCLRSKPKRLCAIEKALHKAFAPQRVNDNREFFKIHPEQAKAILELFHHKDITDEVTDEIQNDLTDDDKAASIKAQKKRPPLNFNEMGMQKGDFLYGKMTHQLLSQLFQTKKSAIKAKKFLSVHFQHNLKATK